MEPMVRKGPARIGPHIHSAGATAGAMRWINAVRPPIVKFLDGGDPAVAGAVRAYGGHAILRVYRDTDQQTLAGVRDYHQEITEAVRHRWPGLFDLVEVGFNECMQAGGDLARKADMDIAGMILAERLGVRAVIGSFSVGQPGIDDWRLYMPALQYAAAHGHLVGLHEYGGPAMQWGAGANQVSGLVGGQWQSFDPATRPGVDGWFALRYRKAVAAWRRLGLTTIPGIVITESGLDDIQPRPELGHRTGWKTYAGLAPLPAGDYADQLRWYAERLTEDPYIMGAVDFGFADASRKWDAFDLSNDPNMLSRVIDGQARVQQAATTQEPPVTTPPYRIEKIGAEAHGDRLGYRPRYLVIHSTASGASMDAAATARYLAKNERGVSIHYTAGAGVVYAGVDESRAAYHVGGSRLPDGTQGTATAGAAWVDLANACSIGIELFQTTGQPTAIPVRETGLALAIAICRRVGIPSKRVVAHREIDPARRSDPVGVDMEAFRRDVAIGLGEVPGQPPVTPRDPAIPAGLAAFALERGRTPLNPNAALYKAARSLGYNLVTPEFDYGASLIGQVAMDERGQLHLVWVTKGQWSKVSHARLT